MNAPARHLLKLVEEKVPLGSGRPTVEAQSREDQKNRRAHHVYALSTLNKAKEGP